jgi:hypothetical protein
MGDFAPGDGIVYRPYPGAPAEDGVVVRTTDEYVFVRYRGSETPKATRREDLRHADPSGD